MPLDKILHIGEKLCVDYLECYSKDQPPRSRGQSREKIVFRAAYEQTLGKLQSDPTKDYAKQIIKPRLAVPNSEMINAYNTYEGTGLPPGAICSPGLDAIDAVLEKMPSDYFYFVANIYTRETFFSQDSLL